MTHLDVSTASISYLAVAPPVVAQHQSADWGLVRAEQVDIIRHEPFRRPTSNQLANGSAKQATLPACTQLRQPALRICAFSFSAVSQISRSKKNRRGLNSTSVKRSSEPSNGLSGSMYRNVLRVKARGFCQP